MAHCRSALDFRGFAVYPFLGTLESQETQKANGTMQKCPQCREICGVRVFGYTQVCFLTNGEINILALPPPSFASLPTGATPRRETTATHSGFASVGTRVSDSIYSVYT